MQNDTRIMKNGKHRERRGVAEEGERGGTGKGREGGWWYERDKG